MLKKNLELKSLPVISFPTVEDVDAIQGLISQFSVNSKSPRVLLPRSEESILTDLHSFILLKMDEVIVGCVSLKIWSRDRAEVRSLAVKPGLQGYGIGKQLLKELSTRAKQLKIKTLFALTVTPEFFKKSGFHVVPKLRFPEKIVGDCLNCSFQTNCLEVAVSKTLLRAIK
ncbi:MAG: GNAT family N-acetyltransferase [Xanthomonadaceae bacterium]|nr:GNAT family N-acetyltransferase [Xanthomonadaceae bacterium]